MIPSYTPFSLTTRFILIAMGIVLLQMNVPTFHSESFAAYSHITRLKAPPVNIYKPIMTLMASVQEDFMQYKDTADTVISKTAEAVKTWKIVKVESKKVVARNVIWPVNGSISSKYGMRIHPVTHKKSFHNGIDIRAKSGTSVQCPTDCVVIDTGWAGALGRMVKVKTSTGHTLCFGHLSKINCKEGQKLSRGQVLGKVGSTGRATGPHLHFTVCFKGDYMNPIKYLAK